MKTAIKISMTLMVFTFIINTNQAQVNLSKNMEYHPDSSFAKSVNKPIINQAGKVKNIPIHRGKNKSANNSFPSNTKIRDHRTNKNTSVQGRRNESKEQAVYFDEADALFGKRTNVRDYRNKN